VEDELREVEREIARWEDETGQSVEAVAGADPMMRFEGLSEDRRREANELWERLQFAREREQGP
jgi:hypothetical protein